MRPAVRRLVPLLALLVAGGCAVSIDVGRNDQHDALDRAIAGVAAEVNLHQSLLSEALTLDEGRAEVARHLRGMDDAFGEVDRHLDIDCADSRGMATMDALLAEVEQRVALYDAEVRAATTLAAVVAASDRYGEDMDELLDRMTGRWNRTSCDW